MFGDDVKNLSKPVNLNISDYSNEPTEPNSLAVVKESKKWKTLRTRARWRAWRLYIHTFCL